MTTLVDFVLQNPPPQSVSQPVQQRVWDLSLKCLADSDSTVAEHSSALAAVKILSRDRTYLEELMEEAMLTQLLAHAGIVPLTKRETLNESMLQVIKEAQSCLFNFSLQSAHARQLLSSGPILRGLMDIVVQWKDLDLPYNILLLDLKLLMLSTAFITESRTLARVELRAISKLLRLVDTIITDAKDRAAKDDKPHLTDSETDLVSEVLKVLFNITLVPSEQQQLMPKGSSGMLEPVVQMDEEDEKLWKEVTDMMHSLITIATENEEKSQQLTSNCVNLLANTPMTCTHPLLGPLKRDIVPVDIDELEYDGDCMNVPNSILRLLLNRIDQSENKTTTIVKESITPVLSVLFRLAQHHRQVRKFFRATILPPLRDMTNRPEEGDKARNKLCKLLTSPIDAIGQMTAEFLFVLCKESVTRMVKHTGYGNAAGLLARRGLMLGGNGANASDYSDEEDSDTEEYSQNAHKVNPVVGCVEPQPRASPWEGMTDEQKEYEAMKLVNLINDMSNIGVIRPALPGPDGQNVPMEHIMQLRDALPAGTVRGEADGEESDDN